MPPLIEYGDLQKIEVRVGTVLKAEPNPKARTPAIVMDIDFGPSIGVKRTSAQITAAHDPGELPGTQVVAILNLPPKLVAGVRSEVLVLGAMASEGTAVLLAPRKSVPPGSSVR
jgi:tRNA-binding protein